MEAKDSSSAQLIAGLLQKQSKLIQVVEEKERTIHLLSQEIRGFHDQILSSGE